MLTQEVLVPVLICLAGAALWLLDSSEGFSDHFLKVTRKRTEELPDKTRVRARLAQLGREKEYEKFRIRQISFSSVLTGTLFLFLFIATGVVGVSLAGSALGGVSAYFLFDRQLSKDVVAHRLAIESEFASIIEMLTLSLSAGETPLAAISRISTRSSGLLGKEFARITESVRSGKSFTDAVDAMGHRIDSLVIRRFVDSLVTAISRGAPLIEVLQRHAAEARQNQRNILMDRAGKAEIAMMVPVVFLILPISVLFALWPSLIHLNLFAS